MADPTEECLRCEQLERFLGEDEARVHVLRGVSLTLERGQVHAVVGPSGCGKSSLRKRCVWHLLTASLEASAEA